MRLALFSIAGIRYAIPFEKVLHILQAPDCYDLPLLRRCFSKVFLYDEQLVPLASIHAGHGNGARGAEPLFVMVCEAEYGRIGLPADTVERISTEQEYDALPTQGDDTAKQTCQINGREYRLFDLNHLLEASTT